MRLNIRLMHCQPTPCHRGHPVVRALVLWLCLIGLCVNQSRAEVTRLSYPSQALADQALITFHGQLLSADFDNGTITLDLDAAELAQLEALGFTAVRTANGPLAESQKTSPPQAALQAAGSHTGIEGFACYPTVDEMFAQMAALASEYPQLVSLVDIGDSWRKSQSQGGYDLLVLKLGNPATDAQFTDKPRLFVQAAMHAREYTTAALALDFARHLLEAYPDSADISSLLDRHEIHILPVMNPDGRVLAEQPGLRSKRKNDNGFHCAADVLARGVDLNRNFSYSWQFAAAVPGVRASDEECDQSFRGPFAASETETQAVERYVRELFVDSRDANPFSAAPVDTAGLHIDLHSFGQLVLYPWGFTSQPAGNADELKQLAGKVAGMNGYTAMQGIGLYPIDGGSESIAYGELGVAQLTFELGTHFFEPCESYHRTVAPDNIAALLYAAKVARAPYQLPAGPDVDFLVQGRVNPDITVGNALRVSGSAQLLRFDGASGAGAYIESIEYSINQHPDDAATGQSSVLAQWLDDGQYDASQEQFSWTLPNTLAPGRHVLYLRARSSDGQYGPVTAQYFDVIETEYLAADIAFDCRLNRCEVSGLASQDTDGVIEQYLWDLGDGESATDAQLTHFYNRAGSYAVSLDITGSDGSSERAHAQIVIDVSSEPPVAVISSDCNGLSCQFSASASQAGDGSLQVFYWRINGGPIVESPALSFDFAMPQTAEVELGVEDSNGWLVTTRQAVRVEPAVAALVQASSRSSGGGGSVGLLTLLSLLVATWFRRRY